VSGWADWSDLHPQQQRVGLVHAVSNTIAASLYTLSLAARMRGEHLRGRAYGFAGLSALSVGGYLGGHLSYRQAAGANHGEDIPHTFPAGWQDAGTASDLPEGELTKRSAAGLDLLVMRRGQAIDVLANRCSHLSAPLSDGSFSVSEGEGCVVCPWHGSTFRLSDGTVVHGPATSPQVRFDWRVVDDRLQVLLPGADG